MYVHILYEISSSWNQLVTSQSIFNLTDFHYSRPSNKIYVCCIFMSDPAFLFRPSNIYGVTNEEQVVYEGTRDDLQLYKYSVYST